MRPLKPVEEHVLAFGEQLPDGTIVSSTKTIEDADRQHGGKNPAAVGAAVGFFNNTFVGGNCPVGKIAFGIPGNRIDFGSNLHEGTFRFFNRDGSINEARIRVLTHITDAHGNIALSALLKALDEQVKQNQKEYGTGRDGGIITGAVEIAATKVAWGEVFALLAREWKPNPQKPKELEPHAEAKLVELFFRNNRACLDTARRLGLPVEKPAETKTCCIC